MNIIKLVMRQLGALVLLTIVAACGSTTTTSSSAQPTAASAAQSTTVNVAQPTAANAAQPTDASISTIKLNLNTATEAQLTSTIPNFPSRMVREFFEYRPYVSISQFRKEIGKYVDAAQVSEYEKYVYVPVSANDADAATLQQLPGVDAGIADQLIAGRPYASNEAFSAKLATFVSADQAKAAAAYLAQ